MLYKRNLDEMEWQDWGKGPRFKALRKSLTPAEGPAPKIGASVYRLAPETRAFPRHCHMANDEVIFVLKGSGTLVYGDEEHAVTEGEYIHLPAGTGAAHQMVNTGTADLEYLCLSTMTDPEIAVYPDSGKIGVFAGRAPGSPIAKENMIFEVLRRQPVDYWEGEETD